MPEGRKDLVGGDRISPIGVAWRGGIALVLVLVISGPAMAAGALGSEPGSEAAVEARTAAAPQDVDECPSEPVQGRICRLFDTYCRAEGKGRSICRKENLESLPSGRKWMVLQEHCSCSGMKGTVCASLLSLSPGPQALMYSHGDDDWTVHPGSKENRSLLKSAVDHVPTISLSRGESLVVGVEDTNPLLYALTPVSAKEEDVSGFADLQKLAGLLGGILGDLAEQRFSVTEEMPEAQDVAGEFATELGGQVRHVRRLAGILEARKGAAIRCVNYAELRGQIKESGDLPVECRPSRYEDLRSEIRGASLKLSTGLTGCLAPAGQALAAMSATPGASDGEPHASLEQPLKALVQPEGPCWISYPRTMKVLQEKVHGLDDPNEVRETLKNAFDAMWLVAELPGVDKKAASVIVSELGKLDTAAANLQLFRQRLEASLVAGATESEADACISRRLFLEKETSPVKWSKIQTYEMKISASSPFAEEVARSRPSEITRSCKTAWTRRGLFGVSAALTYTELEVPSWSAVPIPNDPNMRKTVRQTGEETRAGEVALFLHYRFLKHALGERAERWYLPGLEIGAGLDADNAAFFAGLAFELSKYVRVGAGRTVQKVKSLDGQDEGKTIVTDSAAIKTRDDFDDEWYISFSLAIDSLKFFGGGSSSSEGSSSK